MSLEQKKATVTFDPSNQSPESLSEAIEDMGFDSSLSELSPASPVLAETQVIPAPTPKPAAKQETVDQLSHTAGLLEVREVPAQSDLAVAFAPPPLVDVTVPPLVDAARSPSPKGPSVSPSRKAKGGVSLLKLCVEGMTCHSCVTTIEGKIGKLNGVEKIKGDVLEHFTDSSSGIN